MNYATEDTVGVAGGRDQVALVVDGGATNLRMGVVGNAGPSGATGAEGGAPLGLESVIRQVEVPGFNWTAGQDPVEQQRDRVAAAWSELGRPAPVSVVALGLTGSSNPDQRRRLAPLVAEALDAERVLLTGDDVTTHVGVLGGAPGVVITSGTGVACLAVTTDGRLLNVDGLGYLFGDVGGGFWMGRAGIVAALDALERGGPSTALLDRLGDWIASYAGSDTTLRESVKLLYKRPTLIADVASFASEVIEVAATDEVAGGICARAGAELAQTAASALDTAFAGAEPESVQVSWSGSVLLRSTAVFDAFTASLSARAPAAVLTPPDGDSVRGATLLASGAELPHLSGVVRHDRRSVRYSPI